MVSTKIALIDDEPVVREGLKVALAGRSEFDIVATAGEASAALSVCKEHKPDILVLELAFANGMNGIRAAKEIRTWSPSVKIVFFSAYADKGYVRNMIRFKANGYILKTEPIENYNHIFKTLAGGNVYVSPEITKHLIEINTEVSPSGLTEREVEVLSGVVANKTNQQIAYSLSISIGTVNRHIENMRLKLECKNKQALKNYAIKYDYLF